MRTVPNPGPAPTPDDELDRATANPWWSPVTNALLAQLAPEPATDEEIGGPAP